MPIKSAHAKAPDALQVLAQRSYQKQAANWTATPALVNITGSDPIAYAGLVAFDPTAVETPNLSDNIDERAIGSLGVHLVMKLMDEVSYRRNGNINRLVLRKFLVAG